MTDADSKANKISVVVPVFNAESYLEQCIDSLKGQSFANWEALLIDDGSTDDSLKLSEELSRRDDRIRVFHQGNQGPSAARNYGLEVAEGRYIFFLDSDDALHPLLLEEMMLQIEKQGVQMAFCNSVKLEDAEMNAAVAGATVHDKRPVWNIGDGIESERWFHVDYLDALSSIGGLISRDVIGSLRFDASLAMGEDGLFKYELFAQQVPVAYTSASWYFYRINYGGLCRDIPLVAGKSAAEKAVRIRDSEYAKGNLRYAQIWEEMHTSRLRWTYEICKKAKNDELCAQIRDTAQAEYAHPLFQSASFIYRFLFDLCFKHYFLYVPVSWLLKIRRVVNEKAGKNR